MSMVSEVWGILSPKQRRSVLTMQLVSIVMAFSTLAGIAAIAPFFAVLGQRQLIEHNALLHWAYMFCGFSSEHTFTLALGIAFVATMLLANIINVAGSLAMSHLALGIGTELQSTLFGEYLSRPYAFHLTAASTALFNNVLHETGRLTNGILLNSFLLVTNLVSASLIVVSVLLLKPLVAIAMIAALAGGYALIYLLVRRRLIRFGEAQSLFAVEQARILNAGFAGIKEIIVLQAQRFFRDSFERASRSYSAATAHSQVVAQNPRHLMECIAAIGLVGLALLLSGGENAVGQWLGPLTFLAFAAYRLLPNLQQVFASIVKIRADRAALLLIVPDLRRARTAAHAGASDAAKREPVCGSGWDQRPRREIRIENVSFRYDTGAAWALNRVSLRIPAMATIGIVGPNGSGKTTLIDVIVGLLAPTSGSVEIDGTMLREENRTAWQSRIAYMPQQVFLLDESIAQNIALGVARANIDKNRLLRAAQLAQLENFITSLPAGFEHNIGERGIQLSGGQKQRLGIARALYREASVLVLDEATSALDGLTEQELMTTLRSLRGRYTIVLVAHRMSTVRSCDVVFQLDGGKIIDSGTYEGLLKSSPAFRRLAGIR